MNEQTVVQALHVGQPRSMGTPGAPDPMERPWTSAIIKQPVDGPVYLSKTGLAGDGVADQKNHGGPEKAVLAYPFAHYATWREELDRFDIPVGAFGENFLVTDMKEEAVCIGDTYRVGEATVQVSQPRQPCWKPARRMRIKDLVLRMQETGRTGWYFRVLKEGEVKAGQVLQLVERPFPKWTIARCNEIQYHRPHDHQAAAELAACPLLSQSWAEGLARRAHRGNGV
ncbi:MOSC domain-containing protein [Desmospora profundinema]|uniref:MOSC domain-containing protein YiiM n=1 Tax=Desmospora profundinema TaxID=1571184 RepID=A0ABU1IR69_9BACL|nr:MOSC domain-containing protein [Desmospora profundinema]MDR6227284.1 MOSC domain-containing protein YiiM [Desmospora profundinema]